MRTPEIELWSGEPDDSGEITREFLIADVFTGEPLEGNQLGIFPDGRGLSDELMLKATREMNFSETVFFLPPDTKPDTKPHTKPDTHADAHIRIFTPGGEIPFAGHPTLGSAWVLADILRTQAVRLETGAGLVPVELERENGTITFGRMSQPVPVWAPCDRTPELLEALGAEPRPDSLLPVETYTNGPVNVYVEFPSEAAIVALDPDMQKLGRIPLNVSCFAQTPDAQTPDAQTPDAQTSDGWIVRMFAPALGVTEDPATGSAAGPLAVHLARYGRIKFGEEIEIRQGERIHRPSVLYARAEGAGDTVERVVVGGRAVVVAHGVYRLG